MIDEVGKSKGAAEAKKPKHPRRKKAEAYKNISTSAFYVFGKQVKPGATYEPTEVDQKDTTGRKRLDRAIGMGFIEKV